MGSHRVRDSRSGAYRSSASSPWRSLFLERCAVFYYQSGHLQKTKSTYPVPGCLPPDQILIGRLAGLDDFGAEAFANNTVRHTNDVLVLLRLTWGSSFEPANRQRLGRYHTAVHTGRQCRHKRRILCMRQAIGKGIEVRCADGNRSGIAFGNDLTQSAPLVRLRLHIPNWLKQSVHTLFTDLCVA